MRYWNAQSLSLSPHFGLGQMPDRKHCFANLPLLQQGEKVGLVLAFCSAKNVDGIVFISLDLGVVTCGDIFEILRQRKLPEDTELHFPIAHHIGIGSNAIAISLEQIIDDAIPIFVHETEDPKLDSEVVANRASINNILLPGTIAG